MSTTVQISLNTTRGQQLAEILAMRPDLSRDLSIAAKELLFEYIESLLKKKK